jgi:hypothetical protein
LIEAGRVTAIQAYGRSMITFKKHLMMRGCVLWLT